MTDRERWPCPDCGGNEPDYESCRTCEGTGVCAACRDIYWPTAKT